ncbi:glycosyltransferase [Microbacteriaceae bacterium VKM Ac-2854]|nr:glycosyltransferase [Microbacteriaceae bacterium VKM Ac-2854]
MDTTTIDASVIVVNWRQPELTAEAITSIDENRDGLSVEVILVENDARLGGTAMLRERFPFLVVVENDRNAGFAGGVNSGLRIARGETVVLLNNDAVVRPGFLRAGVERMRSEGELVGAVAARVLLSGRFSDRAGTKRGLVDYNGVSWHRLPDGDESGAALTNSTGIELSRYGNGFDRDWLLEQSLTEGTAADPFGFSGSAAFLRRSTVEALGGFDERLFMYYEDLELSWRMRLAGYRIVYEPGAIAVHHVAKSSIGTPTLGRRLSMRNRLLTTLRNGSRRLVLRVTMRMLLRCLGDLGWMLRHRSSTGESGLTLDDWARIWWRVLKHSPSIALSRMRETSRHRRGEVEREFVGRA